MSIENDDKPTLPIDTSASAEASETAELPESVFEAVDDPAPHGERVPAEEQTPSTAAAPAAEEPGPRPRIRWASVVWGAIFVATGWLTIWTVSDGSRRAAFADWSVGLGGRGWIIVGVVALGALVVVLGLIGGLRRLSGERPARPRITVTRY